MKEVGIGTRVLNCVVDTLLVFLLAYGASAFWNWYVYYWNYPYLNFGWFFFGSLFIYYFIFESLTGRTPAKWLSYSKVVAKNGKRPGVLKVLVRSLARLTLIDLFFYPFLDKTLHDYLSNTRVVEA
jgi:uncharacterized RDD family membrane protein YckC